MTALRAVVFDFDGVVLESADIKTEVFVELFVDHGEAIVTQVRAHHLANLGISRFKKFEWIYENLLRRKIQETESAALGARFSELALARVLAAPFVPGANEALAVLATDYPLYVASGTPQAELEHIIEQRGLFPLFREIAGTPREKPAILRDLMARHGYAPDEVLFIGDGMSDYQAAQAAGVQFLARDTPALHERWVELGVARRPDLRELPALVGAWGPGAWG